MKLIKIILVLNVFLLIPKLYAVCDDQTFLRSIRATTRAGMYDFITREYKKIMYNNIIPINLNAKDWRSEIKKGRFAIHWDTVRATINNVIDYAQCSREFIINQIAAKSVPQSYTQLSDKLISMHQQLDKLITKIFFIITDAHPTQNLITTYKTQLNSLLNETAQVFSVVSKEVSNEFASYSGLGEKIPEKLEEIVPHYKALLEQYSNLKKLHKGILAPHQIAYFLKTTNALKAPQQSSALDLKQKETIAAQSFVTKLEEFQYLLAEHIVEQKTKMQNLSWYAKIAARKQIEPLEKNYNDVQEIVTALRLEYPLSPDFITKLTSGKKSFKDKSSYLSMPLVILFTEAREFYMVLKSYKDALEKFETLIK
jgi:hypothetical protein